MLQCVQYVIWLSIILQESILLDPMFEIPGSDVVSVHVTEDAVNGKMNPHCRRSQTIDEAETKLETRAKVE